MADTIYKLGNKYAYKCPCGDVEGGFRTESEAKIALQLHQIGCKKS